MREAPKSRVYAYIDGFNLYYGLKRAQLRSCYWLNIWSLCSSFLRTGQELQRVKYFSARVRKPREKHLRQAAYLDALTSLPGVTQHFGLYQMNRQECRRCNNAWDRPEEKKTDASIAANLVADALRDRFDVALLISADSDLVPPIEVVRHECPEKTLLIVFPTATSAKELRKKAHGTLHLTEGRLRQHQFPSVVTSAAGFPVTRPAEWS